jgi:putative FmdB family regulatory protein
MPIYEYRCESCGYQFERMQSFSAEPLRECPRCQGTVHRVISPVGIIFKGSGFYITDNRQLGSGNSRKPKKSREAEEKTTVTSSDD